MGFYRELGFFSAFGALSHEEKIIGISLAKVAGALKQAELLMLVAEAITIY